MLLDQEAQQFLDDEDGEDRGRGAADMGPDRLGQGPADDEDEQGEGREAAGDRDGVQHVRGREPLRICKGMSHR